MVVRVVWILLLWCEFVSKSLFCDTVGECGTLIQRNAGMWALEQMGDTPLILAASHGQAGMLKALAASGAALDARNNVRVSRTEIFALRQRRAMLT